jgi:hypothetical protein
MTESNWTPTPRQVEYVKSLIFSRIAPDDRANWFHHLRQVDSNARLGEAIDTLRVMPFMPWVEVKKVADEPGLYKSPSGEIYRLMEIKDRPGRLRSQRLVPISGTRLSLTGEAVKLEWVFANRSTIDKSWKVDDKAMLEFGIQYRHCAHCWKRLKDITSVNLGIGPVCRKKLGMVG